MLVYYQEKEMTTFKKVLLISIFLPVFGFGQHRKLTASEARRALDTVQIQTSGIHVVPIQGAMLVREASVNNQGDSVWLSFTLSGDYVMRAITTSCDVLRLGEANWQVSSDTGPINALVLDTKALMQASPFFPTLTSVEVFRIANGQVEQLSVNLGYDPGATPPTVVGSGVNQNGELFVTLRGNISNGATIGIGRNAIATQITGSPTGEIFAIFPQSAYIPGPGLTTLTVCQDGMCTSTIFELKTTVPQTGSTGKG
jgi:hypothetical protein